MKRPIFNSLRSLASTLLLFALCLCAWSQTQTPAPTATVNAAARQAIISKIEQTAKNDFKADGQMHDVGIVTAYKNNTVGLDEVTIRDIYQAAFLEAKKENQPGPFDELRPNLGWIAAVLIALWALCRKKLEEFATSAITVFTEPIYNRCAGSRWLRRLAIKKYRKSLIEQYQRLRTPFGDHTLDMRKVYVPLKEKGDTNQELIDPARVLSEHQRLMVVGPPGSGKSMLMRRIALAYAEGRLEELPPNQIPVLLELHKMNDSKLPLEQHLVQEFDNNGFPNADRFVAQHLKAGSLLLLLDGLDEVNSEERDRIVKGVTELLEKYKSCPVIITCRNAVYRDEFSFVTNRNLEIDAFSDEQISSFLYLWWVSNDLTGKLAKKGKSVEQLMSTLEDRPAIKLLARNPLLLTIIAYLYSHTNIVLPHSRADFYRRSTDILLEQWDEGKHIENEYEPAEKRAVLQHLAFFHHKNAPKEGDDRRSIKRETVFDQMKEVLPRIPLDFAKDSKPLLNEIVERSGLLLRIDGGEKFTFSHLTLQEFFAADKMKESGDELLNLFIADPDAWREPIKLWCGLVNDSTSMIRGLYPKDSLLAFECLADAKTVDPSLSADIINNFKARLGEDDGEEIPKAFGALAASDNPRGKDAFQFLESVLGNNQEIGSKRTAAANALSLSNLPKAAALLSQNSTFRTALLRMGDLAVPALRIRAAASNLAAFIDLQKTGTPRAAESLAALLWAEDTVAHRASFHLAALFAKPEIEATLRSFSLNEEQRHAPQIAWVWEPFNEPNTSALPIIAGRIAYLLAHIPEIELPQPQQLDPRLIVPLCATEPRGEVKFIESA